MFFGIFTLLNCQKRDYTILPEGQALHAQHVQTIIHTIIDKVDSEYILNGVKEYERFNSKSF